jgi:hypothetical protein
MVLAVRLEKMEQSRLAFFSKKRHMNKSQAAKELMKKGYLMYQLDEYKAGNTSLGALAETLDLSMLETLNLVATYNAHPHVPKDYLVEAAATAKTLFA